jgi:hypothetical protein
VIVARDDGRAIGHGGESTAPRRFARLKAGNAREAWKRGIGIGTFDRPFSHWEKVARRAG